VPCALDVYALAKVSYMTPWDENRLIIILHALFIYLLRCLS